MRLLLMREAGNETAANEGRLAMRAAANEGRLAMRAAANEGGRQ